MLLDNQTCECAEEKSFCTQCGTKLAKGQVCACTVVAPQVVQSAPIPEPPAASHVNLVTPMVSPPVTTIDETSVKSNIEPMAESVITPIVTPSQAPFVEPIRGSLEKPLNKSFEETIKESFQDVIKEPMVRPFHDRPNEPIEKPSHDFSREPSEKLSPDFSREPIEKPSPDFTNEPIEKPSPDFSREPIEKPSHDRTIESKDKHVPLLVSEPIAEYPPDDTMYPSEDTTGVMASEGTQIIPDQVVPTANEVTIRQYNVTTLRSLLRIPRGVGHMQITNKRLIYRSQGRSIGGSEVVHQEINISEITGIAAISNHRVSLTHVIIGLITMILGAIIMAIVTLAFTEGWFSVAPHQPAIDGFLFNLQATIESFVAAYGRNISQISLLIGLMVGFAGIAIFFILRRMFWGKLVFLGTGLGGFFAVALTGNIYAYALLAIAVTMCILGLIVFCVVPDFVLEVSLKSGNKTLVRARRSFAAVFTGHSTASAGYAEVAPTEDVEGAVQELGAIIADIQEMGVAGVERWSF